MSVATEPTSGMDESGTVGDVIALTNIRPERETLLAVSPRFDGNRVWDRPRCVVTGIGDPHVLEGLARRHFCTCGKPQWSVVPIPCPVHGYEYQRCTCNQLPPRSVKITVSDTASTPDRVPSPKERPDGEAMRPEDV